MRTVIFECKLAFIDRGLESVDLPHENIRNRHPANFKFTQKIPVCSVILKFTKKLRICAYPVPENIEHAVFFVRLNTQPAGIFV